MDYNVSLDSATQKLYKQLVAFNVQLDTLVIDNYYEDIAQARRNANLWANAKKLADVRDKIEPVRLITRVVFVNLFHRSEQVPGIRINEQYLGGGQPQAVTKKQAVSLNQVSRLTTCAWIVFLFTCFFSGKEDYPRLFLSKREIVLSDALSQFESISAHAAFQSCRSSKPNPV